MGNVKNKYDADEQAAVQHFEVSNMLKFQQKFGFINRVDNVNWPLYRDSKS